jgi:hypothetical protein
MKLLVCLVFICDTLNSVFDVMYIYTSLVVHFGTPSPLNVVQLSDPHGVDDPEYLTRANWGVSALIQPSFKPDLRSVL